MIQEGDAQRQPLEAREKRKTGKWVMLQNKSVVSTPGVFTNAQERDEPASSR